MGQQADLFSKPMHTELILIGLIDIRKKMFPCHAYPAIYSIQSLLPMYI